MIANRRIKITVQVLLCLLLVWWIAVYVITKSYYLSRAEALVKAKTSLSQTHANDLADRLQRNLLYVEGTPDLLAHTIRFDKELAAFGTSSVPSRLSFEERKSRWTSAPALNRLSRLLAVAKKDIDVDLIYVLDAAGDSIAASNWDSAGSPIGSNYAEREFFQANKTGQHGMQYAFGRTTHIPGIYFSSPVMHKGKFLGAIVAKIDVPKLKVFVNHTDAYVVDKYGVIILAHDKAMEMLALPDAPVGKMDAVARKAIYQVDSIPAMQISKWNEGDFPSLNIIEGKDSLDVVASKELPQYGFTVFVEEDIRDLKNLKEDRVWFALLIGMLGSVLILVVAGLVFYVRDIKRTSSRLRESEMRLNDAQRTAKLGSWEFDHVSNKSHWSDEVFNILEIPKSKKGANYDAFLDTVHPEDRERVKRIHSEQLTCHASQEFVHRLLMKDGRVKYLSQRCQSEFNEDGALLCSIGTMQDITENMRIEESMQLRGLIYQSSAEAVMITDESNLILDVNPAFTKLTGYLPEDVIGENPSILKSGRHDRNFYREMWESLLNTGRWQGEVWDKRKDGTMYAKFASLNVIRHSDGRIYRYVAQFFDITEKKQQEELIWKQANFDSLTELPNRRLFYDRLRQETKKAHRSGLSVALLFLDLDRFKEVNDTLGHSKGDQLLIEAARRISNCVRETDTVARLGGDEFTVILNEIEDGLYLERIAQNIIDALSRPFEFGGGKVAYVSVSIGITLYPEDADSLDDLMRQADQAMYAAKESGRNRFNYFTQSMQQEAQEKLELTNDLRHALANDEFEIHYQPIVDMRDGHVHKAEALLRWNHQVRGKVDPGTFIPLAEESGLITEIGEWVFQQAIADIQYWRKKLGRTIQVSVNKSPLQFTKSGKYPWMDTLAKAGLPINSINVEITEGVLLEDTEEIGQQLLEFRNSGIEVSIDDFGTGFSALSYLKQFDIDYLKIDSSFVRDVITNKSDMALTEAIIVMAHKLGIKTIAEGVETEAQRDLLVSFGCDYIQGYLYSRPVPKGEFEEMLGKKTFDPGEECIVDQVV